MSNSCNNQTKLLTKKKISENSIKWTLCKQIEYIDIPFIIDSTVKSSQVTFEQERNKDGILYNCIFSQFVK